MVALPNFLSEGVRCGLDKEIAPDGTYLAYFPFGAMIERSQMTPYHKKLWDRVIPRSTPRMTAEQTTYSEIQTLNSTVLAQCLDGILRAGGGKTT